MLLSKASFPSTNLGLTNKEISNYLEISLKAVEKRMTQAIKFLKENINE